MFKKNYNTIKLYTIHWREAWQNCNSECFITVCFVSLNNPPSNRRMYDSLFIHSLPLVRQTPMAWETGAGLGWEHICINVGGGCKPTLHTLKYASGQQGTGSTVPLVLATQRSPFRTPFSHQNTLIHHGE